jgi:hypothetical protein
MVLSWQRGHSGRRASKLLMEMEDGWLLCSALSCTGQMYRSGVPGMVSLVQVAPSISVQHGLLVAERLRIHEARPVQES